MKKPRVTSQQKSTLPFLQGKELKNEPFTLQELADASGYPLEASVKPKMSRGEWGSFIVPTDTPDLYRAKGTLGLSLFEFVIKTSSKVRSGAASDDKGIYRLWKPIGFDPAWEECATTPFDEIADAWEARRKVLEKSKGEFIEFMTRLKREHAIETGVIERLFDLSRGVTDTFIREGFIDVYVSHEDTDIPVPKLLAHLTDHMDAIDFVFDTVKNERPFTIGFIHELHQLVTRAQDSAEGRDPQGYKTKIKLLKGQFKEFENNPSRPDGTVVQYCPPLQVQTEMEKLMQIYDRQTKLGTHPVVLAAWFHHAFTTIHPYQDGNGRLARLLSSLILIKHGLFPFTVHREDAKEKYITALEQADNGEPEALVLLVCENQRNSIEKALNLQEVVSDSFEDVALILGQKIEKVHAEDLARQRMVKKNRDLLFQIAFEYVEASANELKSKFNGTTGFTVSCGPPEGEQSFYYQQQVIKFARHHDYYFNRQLPKGWIKFDLHFGAGRHYQLFFTVHHYGYDDSLLTIGSFLEHVGDYKDHDGRMEASIPMGLPPKRFPSTSDIASKKQDVQVFIRHVLTVALGLIASEIS
jgi:Fic family protein